MEQLQLIHYFERDFGPFALLTDLSREQAREWLTARRAAGKFHNPDIEGFMQKRYDRDKQLRDAFIRHGGRPQRSAPVYMMLGEHRQWESAYEHPAKIAIPLAEFDPLTVSFTYGDSFAVFNSALWGREEYWNRIYFAEEIIGVIERNGFPPPVDYDFKRGIYPKDKHLNNHLKYIEAHVWENTVLDRYRSGWIAEI